MFLAFFVKTRLLTAVKFLIPVRTSRLVGRHIREEIIPEALKDGAVSCSLGIRH